MLVAELSDQLGNQMFAYAAVKTIALDLGFEFGFFLDIYRIGLCNDTDQEFGRTVDTIFPNIKCERLEKLSEDLAYFRENTTVNCRSAFKPEALLVADNTLLAGHYICPDYFEHRIDQVREWFTFPIKIQNNCNLTISAIRKKYTVGYKLVSVHFRTGDDYKKGGFLLNKNYWDKAASLLLQDKSISPVFIVFYDKKTKVVDRFIEKYRCEVVHNSLVMDLCSISLTDSHIVCNSSFSLMAALLDSKKNVMVFRPSIYPIPDGIMPDDIYHKDWIKVKTTRDYWSELLRKLIIEKSKIKRALKSQLKKRM